MTFEHPVPYKCPICHGWFILGPTRCLVAHTPGTCCHEYETPVAVGMMKGGTYKSGEIVEVSELGD